MKTQNYHVFSNENGVPIKAWINGVTLEEEAKKKLLNISQMPFIHHHIAAMPDVHWGMGATVGSVVPTIGAIIPAAVGVDIGCGMMAARTTLSANDLPESLKEIRKNIEQAIPHGRTHHGGKGDRGAWGNIPKAQENAWKLLSSGYQSIISKYPKLDHGANHINHLGTLGTGNHFIEVCLDEENHVWFMLHSGSRGIGNRIGSHFIELAKTDMKKHFINLPDMNLSYLVEGTDHFSEYVEAVEWAQSFARINRELMMQALIEAVRQTSSLPSFTLTEEVVNCHHNYISRESHFGKEVYLTRKGAVRARLGDLGIIPGSMGARSYIVRGLGNEDSFHSCSHGAGRAMSRTEAKRRFTLEDHEKATAGIECRKDAEVIDETPAAYKPIDAVMEAQKDLVKITHTLKQVICVKG